MTEQRDLFDQLDLFFEDLKIEASKRLSDGEYDQASYEARISEIVAVKVNLATELERWAVILDKVDLLTLWVLKLQEAVGLAP